MRKAWYDEETEGTVGAGLVACRHKLQLRSDYLVYLLLRSIGKVRSITHVIVGAGGLVAGEEAAHHNSPIHGLPGNTSVDSSSGVPGAVDCITVVRW